MTARWGPAINGRLTPGDISLLVPVLVDIESLSEDVTAVVQCAPAVRIEEKSLEDMVLESLVSLDRGKLDIFMSNCHLKLRLG